ncbi:MAG: flagellar export protein FliJ [Firmicutes bacterium]|nr:flagellar export protein FliJ [Bacillota bacterium]
MARFRYSMQSILNIKLKMETQAKQEFSAARAALDEEEERLQGLFDRKAGYEEEAEELLAGILDLRAIEENKMAVVCMENYIAEQQQQVAKAERKLEQARERLTEVMMERKTHETLKEKAFQQFLMDEKRQEGKEIDELTSYTYGQKRKDGGSGVPA